MRLIRLGAAATAVVLSLALAGPTSSAGAVPHLQPTADALPTDTAPRAATVWVDGFDGALAWQIFTGSVHFGTKSQARYRPFNVWQHDGVLELRTRRHCVDKGEALTQANSTRQVCPAGKRTRYSSGRVHRALGLPKGADFRVTFSALMPTKPIRGTRQALWMNNGVGYCDTTKLIGEMDALEWYGGNPTVGRSTSHLSCKPGTEKTIQKGVGTTFPHTSWVEWAMQRRGRVLTYYMGGTQVAKMRCGNGKFAGITRKRCRRILNKDTWQVIMNGEVFHKKAAWAAPDNSKWFPQQSLVLDWVRVDRLD